MKKSARGISPPPAVAALAVLLVVVAAAAAAGASAAVAEEVSAAAPACNAKQLAPCVPALTTGVTPNAECCSNMRAQLGCLCQFAKNPVYKGYVGKPNTRGTITACGISRPRCG